ncbi:MAG TPA: cyclic nucleotide-binding domain-containing protein, partial [Oculatellaceae cyanobacterium]
MLCVEDLVNLDPFQRLPQQRLEWVCDRAQTVERRAGEILVHEGDVSCGVFILVAGQISMTRRSEGIDIPIGQHEAPSFFGEVPALTDEPVLVTMRAATDCRLYKIEADDFLKLLHECRDFERTV